MLDIIETLENKRKHYLSSLKVISNTYQIKDKILRTSSTITVTEFFSKISNGELKVKESMLTNYMQSHTIVSELFNNYEEFVYDISYDHIAKIKAIQKINLCIAEASDAVMAATTASEMYEIVSLTRKQVLDLSKII